MGDSWSHHARELGDSWAHHARELGDSWPHHARNNSGDSWAHHARNNLRLHATTNNTKKKDRTTQQTNNQLVDGLRAREFSKSCVVLDLGKSDDEADYC